MKKAFIAILTTLVATGMFATFATQTDAQCQPIYGGGQNCPSVNIAINKTVQNPSNGAFVDNLGVNDSKFSATQTVTFQIVVTNTGNSPIANITVKDVFPQFTNFISGPGNFDNNSKTLSFEVTSLNVGESRTFTVQGQVVAENQLPQDTGVACVSNGAVATDNSSGASASDNAQFCIQRQVLGTTPSQQVVIFPPSKVTQIPATGVNPLQFVALFAAGLAGYVLRKKAIN